ncbi:MAG: hypothetical protein R2838_23395 [Caldilineaceae bacterium]
MKFLVNSLAAGAGSVIGTQVSLRVGQQRAPHPMPHQLPRCWTTGCACAIATRWRRSASSASRPA